MFCGSHKTLAFGIPLIKVYFSNSAVVELWVAAVPRLRARSFEVYAKYIVCDSRGCAEATNVDASEESLPFSSGFFP